MSRLPIGFIDSGSGGLSVWSAVIERMPLESTIYIGDHAHVPYGEKSIDFIRQRSIALIDFVIQKGAKIIVIACNTSTVAGIDAYREMFSKTPIIGVVPVIKTASKESKTKKIAVLSTPNTASSAYQRGLIHKFASDCTVLNIGCPHLVRLIEQGETHGRHIQKELSSVLSEVVGSDVDVLALGCTHYPFLIDEIRAIVGNDVKILDSGGAVARHVERILVHNGIQSDGVGVRHEFFTTGAAQMFDDIGALLVHKKLYAKNIAI